MRINKFKGWFLGNVNNIDKSMAQLSKREKKSIQIYRIRNVQGNITTNTKEIKSIGK